MKRMLGVLLVLCVSGCSVVLQDSVRSSGTQCSSSRFWYASDLLMAAGLAYLVVSEAPDEGGAYVPVGVLAASGAIGVWKRSNCVRHQETATPEQWARDSMRESQRDAARAEQMRNMTERMKQSRSAPPPASTPSPSRPPAPTGQPTWRPKRQPPDTSPASRPPIGTDLGGTCTCRGYPLGHPRAKEERPESCRPSKDDTASSCDITCKAQGYAIGLFNGWSRC